ncbi:MAG: hypothetical protein M3O71_31540 [Bacteroidota bacterium]|nr:hypothetical protein [Bacteroidota bacterium]
MKDFVTIGLIQPVIDPDTSWGTEAPFSLNINPISAERVWQEIKTGFAEMVKHDNRPDVILIPELHLPPSQLATIKEYSKRYKIIVICGIDFQRNPKDAKRIRNRGAICLPNGIATRESAIRVTSLQFGKTFFTYMERSMFKQGIEKTEEHFPDPEQYMYVFESSELGNFGVMICSDIFDIERIMLYQGRIHHLFIISLNKDLNTYFAMAESLTRLLYCNVVICNTGQYGGSMAVSPYSDVNSRTIYKYIGQRMFNTHVINVPLSSLEYAQVFDFAKENKKGILFKASPPGYQKYPPSNQPVNATKRTS